eukprot:7149124-Prymnesium_polylepis.1
MPRCSLLHSPPIWRGVCSGTLDTRSPFLGSDPHLIGRCTRVDWRWHVPAVRRSARPRDTAEVVQENDDGALRRRGSGRPEASPNHKGAYPLMPGYDGIEITEALPGQQEKQDQ